MFFEISEESSDYPSEMSALHSHDNIYEIYFLDEGQRNYIIDGKFFELEKYDAALIPPNSLHKTGGGKFRRTLLQFSADYIGNYYSDEALSELLCCFEKNVVRLSEKNYRRIKELIKNSGRNLKFNYVHLGYILKILNEDAAEYKKTVSSGNKLVSEITNYILKNFRTIESLDEIAEKHYITKFHMCRIFKEAAGASVITYLNSVKIKNASELLLHTNKSVTAIGFESGFNSTMYFCKVFKKLTGATPLNYRRQLKK